MNASEFNTLTQKLFTAGIQEGVAQKKMVFETMIGIIERQKARLILVNEMQSAPAVQPVNSEDVRQAETIFLEKFQKKV